jgi:hypothetical protein
MSSEPRRSAANGGLTTWPKGTLDSPSWAEQVQGKPNAIGSAYFGLKHKAAFEVRNRVRVPVVLRWE